MLRLHYRSSDSIALHDGVSNKNGTSSRNVTLHYVSLTDYELAC